MGALFGEYSYVLDAKNRVFIPARFREELRAEKSGRLMCTIGFDGCLYLFLPSQWSRLISENSDIFRSEDKPGARAFKRFFFGNATDNAVDEQGRILISQNQKQYALLDKNVIIRGAGNKAEIWAAEVWEKYKKEKIDPAVNKFGGIFDI